MKRKSGENGSDLEELDSSSDHVADGLRLYLPYAKTNRRDPCAGVQNKGFSHPCPVTLKQRFGEESRGKRILRASGALDVEVLKCKVEVFVSISTSAGSCSRVRLTAAAKLHY